MRIFFVLSGFLITGILSSARARIVAGTERTAAAMGRFVLRRGARIFPLYYLVVLSAAALGYAPVRESLPWHLAYLTNVYIAKTGNWPGAASHLWTLSIEEQFYLLWPAVVLLSPARALRGIALLCMAVSAFFGPAVGAWLFPGSLAGWILLPGPMFSLAAGALLSCEREQDPTSGPWIRLALQAGWVAVPMMVVAKALLLHGHQGLALGLDNFGMTGTAAFLVACAVRARPGPMSWLLSSAPLRYLGRISYGIYLLHPFVQLVSGHHTPTQWAPTSTGGWTVLWSFETVAAASVSWYAFERRILRLRDRLAAKAQGTRLRNVPATPP